MTTTHTLAILLLAAPATSAASAQGTAIPQSRIDSVVAFVDRARSTLGLPGVAVSIATGDSVLLATGFGAVTVNRKPIDGHTPFLIGSVTKTLTATAIAQLESDGRLQFDAPIESYLRDFTLQRPFTPRSITVRHLLQHRSGFSQWSGHDKRAQQLGTFAHLAPKHPPGTHAEYSSLNFIVLGVILEAVTAQSYAEHLKQALFEPLGMRDAFVDGSYKRPANMARGHQSYFGIHVPRREPESRPFLVPAGFVGASAYDLARFGGTLVGNGAFKGERLLDSTAVAAVLGPLDTTGRAMSWGRERIAGKLVLEHAGNSRTSSARVRLLPNDGVAIAVLTNTNSGPFFSATDDLMNGIYAILEGEPTPTVWPRERIFKGVLFVGTLWSVVRLSQRVNAWNRVGRSVQISGTARTVGPLAFDVALGSALLFGLPRFVGVPLGTMTEYFPDLGIALVTSASAGMIGGLFNVFTKSAEP